MSDTPTDRMALANQIADELMQGLLSRQLGRYELVATIQAALAASPLQAAGAAEPAGIIWRSMWNGGEPIPPEQILTPNPQPAPASDAPSCTGDPGECAYNGACMYRCGRLEPPTGDAGALADEFEKAWATSPFAGDISHLMAAKTAAWWAWQFASRAWQEDKGGAE